LRVANFRKCRDGEDAPLKLFAASFRRCVGAMAPRKVGETNESSKTRWSKPPEKLSHSLEVRTAFRDASGRSESALSRGTDEIENVVDAVLAEAGRTEQEGRERVIKGRKRNVVDVERQGYRLGLMRKDVHHFQTPSTHGPIATRCNRNNNVFGLVLIVEESLFRLRNQCIAPKSAINHLGVSGSSEREMLRSCLSPLPQATRQSDPLARTPFPHQAKWCTFSSESHCMGTVSIYLLH
jgi:hypothetical protein